MKLRFHTPVLSRRELIGSGAAMAGVLVFGGAGAAMALRSAPVVGFHRDEPFLDISGRTAEWRPRVATDWTNALDDEALFRLGQAF